MPHTENQEMDPKKYLSLVYRMRHLFIAVVLAVMTGAVVYGYWLPKVYQADTTVFIERNVINELIKDIAVTPSMQDRLKVLSYAMSSRNILTKVVNTMGMDLKNDAGLERIIGELQANTKISMKDMDLFVVSFKHKDPRFASEYVNTLVRLYVEENMSAKREEAYGANRFLSEQIKFFKEKLDAIEQQVIQFRKEKGVFVSVSEFALVEDIKKAQDELEAIKIARRETEARGAILKKQLSQEKPYTVAVYSRNSLSDRKAILKKRLHELQLTYTKDYPEVIKVQTELESVSQLLKNQGASSADGPEDADTEMSSINPLHQQLKEESTKSERELAALSAKEEHLRRLVASKQSYLRNIPEEKTKLSELEMERNTYKRIYEELVGKLGQSEVSKQMEVQDKAATFRVVDPAITATKAVSPNRLAIMLGGILAGIATGLVLVIGLDYINHTVKELETVRSLGVAVLAVIPRMQDNEEIRRMKKLDLITYSAAGAYLVLFAIIVLMEAAGVDYIDRVIAAAGRLWLA